MTRTVGNLSKPEPTGQDTLNLRVPVEFKRALKTLAAQQGTSMTDLIVEAIGGNLEGKFPVAPFMKKHSLGWSLHRQSAKYERPGAVHELLVLLKEQRGL